MINPRGSIGFTTDFRNQVRGDWGGAPYQDLLLGLEYAKKTFNFLDEERMCAAGGSYGGYMISWIAGHTNMFKCLVNHAGGFDIVAKHYVSDIQYFVQAESCLPKDAPCRPFDSKEIRERMNKMKKTHFLSATDVLPNSFTINMVNTPLSDIRPWLPLSIVIILSTTCK